MGDGVSELGDLCVDGGERDLLDGIGEERWGYGGRGRRHFQLFQRCSSVVSPVREGSEIELDVSFAFLRSVRLTCTVDAA